MAVIAGGGSGVIVARDQISDNKSDRLLALQAQEGKFDDWASSHGSIVSRRTGSEFSQIDYGLSTYEDGVTNGTNTLTSASGPFEPGMVGLRVIIQNQGYRFIETYTSANEITFSGGVIAAATGVRFTTPVSIAQFTDGVSYGTNVLTSASGPFTADMVGRKTSISAVGTREIVTYTSPTEIEVDGPAFGPAPGHYFTVAIDIPPTDVEMISGAGKTVDAHRTPRLTSPTLLRWVVG
jgi:hypothetical protein